VRDGPGGRSWGGSHGRRGGNGEVRRTAQVGRGARRSSKPSEVRSEVAEGAGGKAKGGVAGEVARSGAGLECPGRRGLS